MSRNSDVPTARRRLQGDVRGGAMLELALLLPILLFLLLGMVEVARAFDVVHELKGIGREGANLASRGTDMDTVVKVMMFNGSDLQLSSRGGMVVSRVHVEDGEPLVEEQVYSGGFSQRSKLGEPGDTAAVLDINVLLEDQTVHVVELFYDFRPATPVSRLFFAIAPDSLYERAIF